MTTRIAIALLATQLTFAAVNYSYDAAGRLTKVDYGAAGSINYTYDKAGNLMSRAVVPAGGTVGGLISEANVSGSPASAGISQNTWLEIRGVNIVPPTTPAAGVIWSTAPSFAQGMMPTQIGDVTVTINGKPAYMFFYCSAVTSACPTDQVNVLSPLDNTTGNVQVVVTSLGVPSAPLSVVMHANVPSFFPLPSNYVVATHGDNTIVGPTTLYPGNSTPAAKNEEIVLWGTGFGLPSNMLTAGSSSQGGSLPVFPVCTVGGQNAMLEFAGLVGTGLIQVNFTIPATVTPGDQPVVCTYNGASSPAGDLLTTK
jgi:uncharacterized protein (TIGR03437 family)